MSDEVAKLGFAVDSKPLDEAKTKLGEVATEAGKTGKAVDDFNQKASKTGAAATSMGAGFKQAGTGAQAAVAPIKAAGAAAASTGSIFDTAKNFVRGFSQGFGQEFRAAIEAGGTAAKGASGSITAVGAAASAAAGGVKAKTAAVSDMEMAVRRMGPVLNQFSGGLGAVLGASNALRLGIVGLAAVAGGAALTALAKVADEVDRAKNRFTGLTGSTEAGVKAFDAVKAAAKASGVEFSAVASAVEKAKIGQDQFADRNVIYADTAERAAKQTKELASAFGTFGSMMQANLANAGETKTALDALGESFKKTGTLTLDAFRAIQAQSPATARAVSEAFGYKNVQEFITELAKAPISLEDFTKRMALVKPTVDATFDPDKPKTFEQAMRGVSIAWDDFLQTLAKGDAINLVADGINLVKGAIQALPGIIEKEARDLKMLGDALMSVVAPAGMALEAVGNFAIGGMQKLNDLANSAISAAAKVAAAIASMFSGSNVPGNAPSLSDTGDTGGGIQLSGGGASNDGYYTSGSGSYGAGSPAAIDYGGGSADYGYFATGGQFKVGGTGGTDSQTVTFKASPDEVVTISTPEDMAKSAKSSNIQGLTTIQGEGGGIVSATPEPAQMATIKEITDAIDQSTIDISKNVLEGSDQVVDAIGKLAGGVASATVNPSTGLPITTTGTSSSGTTLLDRIRGVRGTGGGGGFSTRPSQPGLDIQKINNANSGQAPDPMYGVGYGPGSLRGSTARWSRAPTGQFGGGYGGYGYQSSLDPGMFDYLDQYVYSGDDFGSGSTYSDTGATPWGSNDPYSGNSNYDSYYGGSSDSGITGFDPGVMNYGGGSSSYDYGYFASGGKFVVDGDGGTDTTKVQFHATKGETVEITPAGVANPISEGSSANSDPSNSTTTTHKTDVYIAVAPGVQAQDFIKSRAQIARGF